MMLAPIAALCVLIGVWPWPLLQSLDKSIRRNVVANRVVEPVVDTGWTAAEPAEPPLELITDGSRTDG